MSDRFSALKGEPKNIFKSKPKLSGSKKNWDGDYNSSSFSSDKNKYVPPHMKRRQNVSTIQRNDSNRKPLFIPEPSYKPKKEDFPTIGGESFPSLGEITKNECQTKMNFAGLVKNKINKPEEKKEDLDEVKPGWIRWRKASNDKWIMEIGKQSKKHKKFMRWLADYKETKRMIAFENYLDLLEQREFEDFLINGPKYKNSWDPDSDTEEEYDSCEEQESDSETDSDESFIDYGEDY